MRIESRNISILGLCLHVIRKPDMRKAPKMPGHKGRADTNLISAENRAEMR